MVRGLRTYIKQVRDAQKTVSIEQKIEEWKCANIGATPIIVIDFPGFYRALCNTKPGQLDVLFCNHENSLNIMELVLRRFKNMGVQMEFFYGGSTKFIKNREFISKHQHQPFKHINNAVWDMIKSESNPEIILQQIKMPIYNNAGYFVAAIMLAGKYGGLHKSYYNECERDIARYATRHNAVAILTLDYEFILVNNNVQLDNGSQCQWNFWDLLNFNLTTFEILQIDKNVVQKSLDLSDDELQIFGVLGGKAFPGSLVDHFLYKFGKYPIKQFAEFIKKNFSESTGLLIPVKIASVLSSTNINANAKIAAESLKFFANINDSKPTNDDKFSIAAKRIHNSYAYEYLNNLHIPIQMLYWRKTAYPGFMECALMIHRRQMGVVMQHMDTSEGRWVICINSFGTKDKMVQPVYPSMTVPSLLDLYSETTDTTLLTTKLQLLCWIISDQLNYKIIENIHKSYLSAILTMTYMVEMLFISHDEADCILYCLQECNKNPQLINSLPHPDSISEQPFQLILLYDKFYQFIVMSMNTVGLSDLVTVQKLQADSTVQLDDEFQ